jgi:Flp pilus assembly protein CpaB
MKKPLPNRPRKLRRLGMTTFLSLGCAFLLCVGIIAALFNHASVASNPADAAVKVVNDYDTVLLPTPLRPIAKGEKLGSVAFAKTKWPKSSLNTNYVNNEADYASAVALTPLPAHLPIPISAVAVGAADANAVVEGIPAGFRAITVRVDAESAVEGWARSGNYVDVIVLRQSNDREVGVEAKIIAENVKILSAGRSTEPLSGQGSAPNAPPTVTLLVSQEDALKIKTAANVGKLTFSLRGVGDSSPSVSLAMNQKSLLGNVHNVVPKKQRYVGTAKGPDGNTYVLSEDARWIRAQAAEHAFLPRAAGQKEENKETTANESKAAQ